MGGPPPRRARPLTPRKHIVAIPSWYREGRGAGGGYFRDQALALQAAGHRVAMLVPEIYTLRDLRAGRAPASVGKGITIEHDGIDIYRRAHRLVMPRVPFRNAVSWSLCGLRLFADYVARNGRPDLVHAHTALNAGVLAARIKARYGVPVILTEHSTGFARGRLRWWERSLIRYAASGADLRVAVSPHLAGLLEGHYGDDWKYVPNILGEAFLDTAIPPKSRQGDGFTFICAARLSPEKNHALLLEAFASAFASDPRVRLVLAGNGPTQPALQQLCAEFGIADQVDFLGVLSAPQLRDAMHSADAFVLASDIETFGVVVIEAQSVGLPVIVTASGGPDHLIDRSNGLLVPVGDMARLRDALIKMRRDASHYDRASIRATTLSRYDPLAFARQFDELVAVFDK